MQIHAKHGENTIPPEGLSLLADLTLTYLNYYAVYAKHGDHRSIWMDDFGDGISHETREREKEFGGGMIRESLDWQNKMQNKK